MAQPKEKEAVGHMKELCKERNNMYEKQGDMKGRKWEIENRWNNNKCGCGGFCALLFMIEEER